MIRSQYLRSKAKSLFIENPKENSKLLKHNIAVEEHIYLTHQKDFILLIENFLDNTIDFEKLKILLHYYVIKHLKNLRCLQSIWNKSRNFNLVHLDYINLRVVYT